MRIGQPLKISQVGSTLRVTAANPAVARRTARLFVGGVASAFVVAIAYAMFNGQTSVTAGLTFIVGIVAFAFVAIALENWQANQYLKSEGMLIVEIRRTDNGLLYPAIQESDEWRVIAIRCGFFTKDISSESLTACQVQAIVSDGTRLGRQLLWWNRADAIKDATRLACEIGVPIEQIIFKEKDLPLRREWDTHVAAVNLQPFMLES